MIEIGGNACYCNNGAYQAACCTVTPSMAVYDTCALTQFLNCQDGNIDKCSGMKKEEMGTSLFEASYACRDMIDIKTIRPQRYCCDNRIKNRQFYDCKWDDGGHHIPNNAIQKRTMCHAGCSGDRYKVTFNSLELGCHDKPGAAARGAAARCCKANVQDLVMVHDEDLEQFDSILSLFFINPVCRNPGPLENLFTSKLMPVRMNMLEPDKL